MCIYVLHVCGLYPETHSCCGEGCVCVLCVLLVVLCVFRC